MKTIRLRLSNVYWVDVKDDFDPKNEEHVNDAFNLLDERLAMENKTVSNEFWENLEVHPLDCEVKKNE